MKVESHVTFVSNTITLDPSRFDFQAQSNDANLSHMIEQLEAVRDQSIAFIEQIARAQRAAQPQAANNNRKKKSNKDEEDDANLDGDDDDIDEDQEDEQVEEQSPQKKKQKL